MSSIPPADAPIPTIARAGFEAARLGAVGGMGDAFRI
jgi:hypothetical protein